MSADSLTASMVELQETGLAIVAKADFDKRALTDAELGELDSLFADFARVEAQINPRQRLADQQERLDKLLPPRYR